VVIGLRSENAGRLLITYGPDTNSATYRIMDSIWLSPTMNPDKQFIQMNSTGNLILENLQVLGGSGEKLYSPSTVGQTIRVAGISIFTPLSTFIGSLAATTKVILEGYYQYGSGGGVEWSFNGHMVLPARRAVSSGVTLSHTDPRLIAITTISAPYNIQLPLASSFPAGYDITFKDESGTATANAVTLTAQGGDTLETGMVINTNYQSMRVYTDGVSKWFLVT
jgi:hypothetical protein